MLEDHDSKGEDALVFFKGGLTVASDRKSGQAGSQG